MKLKITAWLNTNWKLLTVIVIIVPVAFTFILQSCRQDWVRAIHATSSETRLEDSTRCSQQGVRTDSLLHEILTQIGSLKDQTQFNEDRLILLIKITALGSDIYTPAQKKRLTKQFSRGEIDPDSILIQLTDYSE